ncbi:MAG: alpha-L-arabinofuranosidase C-terminal domain-containing protein, partial [Bacteroidota bacterium]|nr:alpha-L-arabinofuranosidase C-terminal domain-containing protein [Bacteroidota bacterium]
ASVSPSMYGAFFEEINHAGDGGLYAELVQNRSFEETEMPDGFHVDGNKLIPKPLPYHLTGEVRTRSYEWNTEPVRAWSLQTSHATAAQMRLTKINPMFASAPNNLEVTINDATNPVQLVNEGYWGMGIKANEHYFLRAIIRTSADYKGTIVAKLLSSKGELMASTILEVKSPDQWSDISNVLVPDFSDSKSKLALEFDSPGKVWVDYVSLFPENTFNKRKNGLRNDVAEMLAGLKPAFLRWPGGCVVEGITLDNRYEWKKTLGDPAARPGEYSTWGYRCSYGFGYNEMLQFCEDIGAKAMFVCNVGLGCQFRMGDACPEDKISYYLDDCMDAIEYALGDVSTKWGARRAAEGHPDPFPLGYVEIGNENWGPEYDHRFNLFYKAIKAKYPQLTLIYCEMPERNGERQIEKTDMIDPHWYVAPEFFLSNSTLFDSWERGKYKIYVGEYACNRGVGGGNMKAALSEAAFIGGMERNGDLVTMTSYAPLFENRHNRKWTTNLIWIDNDRVLGRSSYYVQKMASQNRPTYNVKSNITMHKVDEASYKAGGVGFGSWGTSVEYKDITLIEKEKAVALDLQKTSVKNGLWKFSQGVLNQQSLENGTKYILRQFKSDSYTLTCKARKLSGNEGFLVYFGMSEDGLDGYMYNIGGWNNQKSVLQEIANGSNANVLAERNGSSIETAKWYDLKLIVSPKKSELYIDGKLILTHEPAAVPLQFITSGYDEATNELILKVVNADASHYVTNFKLKGSNQVSKIGKVISLRADNGNEENSFDNPKKISPVENEYHGFGKTFDFVFPPYSYTILRIKAAKSQRIH